MLVPQSVPVTSGYSDIYVPYINAGKIHIVEPSLDQAVATAVAKGFLKAATTPIEANTYLIVVPTPFKAKNEPDISFVEAATVSPAEVGATALPKLNLGALSFLMISALPHRGHWTKPRMSWL